MGGAVCKRERERESNHSCNKKEHSTFSIKKKKTSENIGIKQGKILDFHYTANKINQDLKSLEKESNKIFRNISIIVNEPEISCTNLLGFKKLNGSKVEKRDLDYILNEGKSSILKNQEKNSILHILNSNFILDKTKKNKIYISSNMSGLGIYLKKNYFNQFKFIKKSGLSI